VKKPQKPALPMVRESEDWNKLWSGTLPDYEQKFLATFFPSANVIAFPILVATKSTEKAAVFVTNWWRVWQQLCSG